jgi:predicted DNA-binding protein YlxM (UPF0122 family)
MSDPHDAAGRDPSRNSENASYGFDYAEVDRRLETKTMVSCPEELALEFLIRGLLIVKEDARPHLCIDAAIYGLKHPVYQCFSLQRIATWNGVTKQSVGTRVKEFQARFGLSDAHIDNLSRMRSGPLFGASHGLVTALLFVAKYQEPKSVVDCIVQATGHPISDGVSLDTIAKRYGVTKQGIHKQTDEIKASLHLPQSRYNKKPEASQQYAHSNTHTAPVSGISVGRSLSEWLPIPA